MTVQPGDDTALQMASAEQLRRGLKRRLDEARDEDDFGEYIDPDNSRLDDIEGLERARDYWRRGDKREALHHLELALGRDFIGLGDLRPEDLR